MSSSIRESRNGRIFFNFETREQAWSAPNPDSEWYREGRHSARYPMPGQNSNYAAAELGDAYTYLVSECPTTEAALQQLREIRRAVRALRRLREETKV